jgi:pimeloyl-ACP methyl ester carboxylesterase
MTITRDFTLPKLSLAAVETPALVVVGENSGEYLIHAARATAEVLPNASLRLLEGQDHNVAPEALAPVLVKFFTGR